MKKFLILFVLLPAAIFAQNDTDTTKLWKTGGVFTFNFSQVSLTNWVAGGKSSASGIFMVNTFANYKKDKLSWDNSIDLSYGFLKEKDNEVVKSDDKIDFSSKLGFTASKRWNYSGLLNFKSQFAPGYNYPNTDDAISRFMAPGYLNLALGMDYKTENMSVLLSPATGKFTFVTDDVLADAGAFGVDPGKKSRSELGAFVKFEGKTPLVKNVDLQTKLDLFSNYLNNPQNIDVDWKVMVNMKINEYLSANLVSHIIYDDDVDISIDNDGDGTIDETGPRIQFMEMFGLGLSYKF
ncbi:DUF3078 domain-containing protein [Maribellus comscasis]|uniref:DUF3078 domain-containing protein n=1 Tax=Maribellus comscasis TaxID=2681766 RepID=A0A6I6JT72_9BACT|nr:DUF3078 domain-containing protein [Maribellus comscasis]QGY46236.1 DUF3078 domain-containing protein [Maribellus comscasis]